ncbi:hypothetical protein GCM10022419_058380 [Nonomuraea rosea]|uniref:Uncharacterized protein n=1 Tax=Nonomuraea rosea TaxID=638574 RepID=A0ABP6XMY0_9ACTN
MAIHEKGSGLTEVDSITHRWHVQAHLLPRKQLGANDLKCCGRDIHARSARSTRETPR